MAGSINRVLIMGNVGRDPEIRSTQGGSRIANLSVATSESWRDKRSGEKKEKTEWHRVTIWPEALVDVVDKYVRKGDKIVIEGKIETRKWQDQQGQDRYSTEIVVSGFDGKLHLVGGGNRRGGGDDSRLRDREPGYSDAGGGYDRGGYDEAPQSYPPRERQVDPGLDDEIPF